MCSVQLNFIVLQILREVSSINKKVGAMYMEEFSSSIKHRLNDIEKFLSSDLYPINERMPQTLIYNQ